MALTRAAFYWFGGMIDIMKTDSSFTEPFGACIRTASASVRGVACLFLILGAFFVHHKDGIADLGGPLRGIKRISNRALHDVLQSPSCFPRRKDTPDSLVKGRLPVSAAVNKGRFGLTFFNFYCRTLITFNMVSLVQFGIILFVALGSLTYGYCASIIATTLGQPTFIAYFELDTKSNATQLIGAINGLFQAGGLIGALSCLWTADFMGRKKALFAGAAISLLGGALQAGSVHIAMYLVARLLTGYGIGALVSLVPLYQSEIAPPKIRGLLVGIHGVLICVGYTSASWVGLGFYFVNASGTQWRMPLAIQCLPPLGLLIGVMFIPESPRWLLDHDRPDEAFTAFKAARAESVEMTHESAIREEFHLLHLQVKHERANQMSLIDFWRVPSIRKRCIVGFITMFGAQGTATLVINNYGPYLYGSLGFGTVQQLLIQSGWISVCPFGNLINAFIVDRVGRTRLLIFGFVGSVIALIGECITVSIFQQNGSRSAASAAVFFLFLHIGFFSTSVDATSYIYAAEIFPTPLRARGLGISIAGLFSSTIIFLQCAPTAFANIGWKYYIVFIVITSVNAVIIYFYFPETKGLALEDIPSLFGDSIELDDEKAEAMHRHFRETGYREKGLTVTEIEEI